jgi:hypothetical protein
LKEGVMQVTLTVTAEERTACRRAAVHARGIAAGLGDSSEKDAGACGAYAETLDAIARCTGKCVLSDEQKIDVEQASFLLEGVRNGLDNAELDTAAEAVQKDIERLNDLVFRFNSTAAGQV